MSDTPEHLARRITERVLADVNPLVQCGNRNFLERLEIEIVALIRAERWEGERSRQSGQMRQEGFAQALQRQQIPVNNQYNWIDGAIQNGRKKSNG